MRKSIATILILCLCALTSVRALLLAIAIPAVQITACGAKQPSAE